MERYPPWERIASPTELKEKYESARAEINNYKKMAQMANIHPGVLLKIKISIRKKLK